MFSAKALLISPLVLLVVVALGHPAAGAKCVFKKSCTRRAFKCFQPAGSCTQDTSGEGPASVCWANGARLSSVAGTTTVLGRKGKPCITGTAQEGPAGESEVAYVRRGKTYVLRNNLDGTRSFVCPSGKVETYTVDDFRAGIACGRIPVFGAGAACAPGSCP